MCTAHRAVPLPDIQWQLFYNMSTVSAPFGARKPAIDFNQFSTIPLALVDQLSNQFTPTSIADSLGKFMILDHIFDSQIFNYYRLVFTNQLSRQLVQKIFTSISDLLMQ